MRVRKIAFAADHGGVLLKDKLIEFVLRKMPDIEITDLETHGEESVDYPIFGRLEATAPSAQAVTIWRKALVRTSPTAKTPGIFVRVDSSATI